MDRVDRLFSAATQFFGWAAVRLHSAVHDAILCHSSRPTVTLYTRGEEREGENEERGEEREGETQEIPPVASSLQPPASSLQPPASSLQPPDIRGTHLMGAFKILDSVGGGGESSAGEDGAGEGSSHRGGGGGPRHCKPPRGGGSKP